MPAMFSLSLQCTPFELLSYNTTSTLDHQDTQQHAGAHTLQ